MQWMRLRSALLMAATAAAWWSWAGIRLDAPPDAAATPAATATPGAKAAPANSSNDSTELQEIVVTGLRASLERSLDTKRNAAVVMDSISATELGRFPDADVADSLSHIPGVTITRTTGGEGLRINVRGLGPDYNIVTLNNRILATDDDGRQLAFDVLPSELISSRRRAQGIAGIGARRQHRRHREFAHRQFLRQPGISWRSARGNQLQRHVATAWQ